MIPTYYNEAMPLIIGLGRTLLISVIGIAMGLLIGMALAAVRLTGNQLIGFLISAYVNLFRCTPLLVQIVMLYFALPELGIRLSAFDTSWLALGLWGGAYYIEIYRASFGAVSGDEVMAARALGMSGIQAFRDITLPLGFRSAIPAATTMAITQFRSSSFMIAIGYEELTYAANRMVAETFKVFQVFGVAALTYLVVSSVIATASRWLERKYAIPGRGARNE